MSLKYATQKVSDGHYVLEKKGAMRCDVHAFLSEGLFEATDPVSFGVVSPLQQRIPRIRSR